MTDRFETVRAALASALALPPPDGALGAALAHLAPDGAERTWIGGVASPGGPPLADPHARLRVASVTKMAVARAALAVLDPDAPASAHLRWPEGVPVPTHAQLMSHTSGLSDDAGYLVAPPEPPEALIPRAATGAPGRFGYCNLGYLLLGAAMERATGRPLGDLVREHVLVPAGVGGGLNWWRADHRRAWPLWQWRKGWHEEVDGAGTDWDAPLIWREGRGVPAGEWRPGHAAWFSPQGGLRASVAEMARLARFCAADAAPRWRFDGTNGRDGHGLFEGYGHGVTFHERVLPGRRAGHAGHALGVSTGAWLDRDTGCAWGYALTGQPDRTAADGDESFYEGAELSAMRALAG